MKTVKWVFIIFIICALSYFVYVNTIPKITNNEITAKNTSEIQIKKRYDKKGNLKSDVELLKGVRHGVAHNYYTDGSIHSTINYKNGDKEGISTWFYENGKPYRKTPFIKGQKHGTQKKYYKTGLLMAEIPYNKNELQPGTKEYTETGKLIKDYPTYNYKVLNNTNTNGTIIIKVTGKKINKVKYSAFYFKQGKKNAVAGKLNNKTIVFSIASKKGVKEQIKITIWLTIKTKMNNKKIIEKIIPVELG